MPTQQEDRARDVRAAIASARLEGVVITPDARAIFDRYIDGTIDGDELALQVLAMIRSGANRPTS